MFHLRRFLCVGLGAFMLSGCSAGDAPDGAESAGSAPTPIAGAEVHHRDLSRTLVLSGGVRARAEIHLAARTSGTVDSVAVEEGDRVEAGAVLAILDTAESRAELARAQAEARAASIAYERTRDLRNRGVVAAAQYDTARAALDVARSEEALWRTRVDFGHIIAPTEAVVTARHIEPGEAVNTQDTVFELAAVGNLMIRFGVSELDAVHLEPGMEVPLSLDALPDLDLSGEIRRVFPLAERTTRQVTVEIELPEEAFRRGVRPGFLARGRLMVDMRPDLLVVPSASVGRRDDVPYVFAVTDDGQLEQRFIQTGLVRTGWTEVLQGLVAGEIILASNPLEMRDGQAVQVVTMRGAAQ